MRSREDPFCLAQADNDLDASHFHALGRLEQGDARPDDVMSTISPSSKPN
jgi:hypothetical protein